MDQQQPSQDVEPDARTEEEPQGEPGSGSLTDDLDDFDAEVPTDRHPSSSDDDWPEGEPGADPDEALVTPEDPVGPAVGQRFADLHAQRPWVLPGLAVGATLVIAGMVALLRRR